ncbi:DUF1569 domain-containing protein [Leptospira borgpetersenii]|uniref:DUF1569 domain-containing protein n=1 Tax=Leptospira borgpetersenii TaxID=174 RepID=UPI000347ED47|nr:DUF1569 domain-containing protein [Leptospira borgpetersenii]URD69537.1 DUF1569 domain-containing protein [Leptospira borgpetersenii]UVD72712.1 DUF1569 domain-containing protein [Leptospira borgpetersenii]UVD75904.1 DUF1569 domain-containing protein [Leptospira borgpetersenii]UZW32464.1 DUF1569 domain-containing protein [Leptospira borgpetersenii]
MQKLNRREFLNSSVKFFVFIGASGAIAPSLTGCNSEPKGAVDGNLSFVSLSQVLNELGIFKKLNSIRGYGAWDAGKVFLHCAQSIEYSIQGYPENKSALFQNTIGKLVFLNFVSSKKMSHDLEAPIPGSTEIRVGTDWKESLSILRETILKFQTYDKELKPHFAYGSLSKQEYDLAHAMHIANHFSFLTFHS